MADCPAVADRQTIVTLDLEGVLVSRGAATLLWGDADPVGRRIMLPLQSRTLTKEALRGRVASMWRYREVMPVRADAADGSIEGLALHTSQHTRVFFEREGFAVQAGTPVGFAPGLHRYEMTLSLEKTARSSVFNLAHDYSTALFNAKPEMILQGQDIPIHLGSLIPAMKLRLAMPSELVDIIHALVEKSLVLVVPSGSVTVLVPSEPLRRIWPS